MEHEAYSGQSRARSKMKLWLVTVGHKMPDWITTGFNEYAKRMPRESRIELV